MYHHFMLNINKKVPHYVLMKKNGFVWGFFEIKKIIKALQACNMPRHGTLLFNINSYTQFEENR